MALCSMRVRRMVLASLFIVGLLAGDAQAAAGGRLPMPVSAPNGTVAARVAANGTAVGIAARNGTAVSQKGGVESAFLGTLWALASKIILAEVGTALANKVKSLLGGKKVDKACADVIGSAVKTVADDYDVTVSSLRREIEGLKKFKTQVDTLTRQLNQCKSSQTELNKCKSQLVAAQKSERTAKQGLTTCQSAKSDLEDKVQELQDEVESCDSGSGDDGGSGDDSSDDDSNSDDSSDDSSNSDDSSGSF